jgi:hypothetical protein
LGCNSHGQGRRIKLRVKKPKVVAKAESAVESGVTVDEERKQKVGKARAGSTMKVETGDAKSVQQDDVEHKASADSATV